jgi:hypothetical protein
VIDASMDKRIATNLKKRGRRAVSAAEQGWGKLKDPPLLRALAQLNDPWVLVTADDRLPFEHAGVVAEVGATIATLDSEWGRICARVGRSIWRVEYDHDTVHRWAHVMESQAERSIRRYSITSHALWRSRRKYGR